MIPLERAQKIIAACALTYKTSRVLLETALHRTLSRPVYAVCDGPDFDKSVMDGFAVIASDTQHAPVRLEIVESIAAGQQPRRRIKKGTCAQIATGAMLPGGCDAVVMKEDTEYINQKEVKILESAKPGDYIYRKGADYKKNGLLLKQGTSLTMPAVALLASVGIKYVDVFKLPRVAVLATGDEIVEPGSKKRRGQIWNASASMLCASLRSMDLNVDYLGIASDRKEALLKKIKKGLERDCLIITGAVSAGAKDFVPQVLRKAGARIRFHKVLLRPGKPLLFATKKDCLVFALPGNPVSGMVCFLLFVKSALEQKQGFQQGLFFEEGVLAKDVYNRSGRVSLLPAKLKEKGRESIICPLRYSGSADLLAVARADCFFVLAAREVKKTSGSRVKFLRIKN